MNNRYSIAARKRWESPEYRKKMDAIPRREEDKIKKSVELMAKMAHKHAKLWRIKSPDGKIYEFKNANKFCWENRHLFPHMRFGKYRPDVSPLSSLRVGRRGSWRGWTWAGGIIEAINGHRDLLDRESKA